MNYSSIEFLVAFPAFLVLHWTLRSQSGRLVALLIASLAFYAYGEPTGIPLLLAIIVLTYASGVLIARWPAGARWIVAIHVAVIVLDLAALKYAAFIDDAVGLALLPQGGIAPLGVSFFSFESIAYVVDLERKTTGLETSPLRIALYVALFPHLISGPIMRPNDILPQLRAPLRFESSMFVTGLQLFVEGLVKKRLLADTCGVVVDQVFAAPERFATGSVWIAAVAYTLQIYGDFSGYTDMGRGIARMLGIELPRNFDAPYTAASIQEFWRRWHISLSSWLRDYLYIPLGGSRMGAARTAVNLLVTMLIGGLWHGAGWTFVAWGGYHGLLLALERVTAWPRRIPQALAGAITFWLVVNGWVLFRAREFPVFLEMVRSMYLPHAGAMLTAREATFVGGALALVLGAMALHRWRGDLVAALRIPDALCGACYGVAWAGVLMLAPTVTQPFIYFRF